MTLKDIKRWLPLIALGGAMALIFATGIHHQFTLSALQDNKSTLLSYVGAHPVLAALTYTGLYIAFVALSLPAATLLTLAGGFLFGPWLGTLYVVTGATIGAVIVFLAARTSMGATLREKAGGIYKRIEANMNENAFGYLLFMRLVPLFPFFLVNIVPALFNVRLRVYVLTTFFGIIPGSFVYVNLGGRLASIKGLNDLISFQTLLAFGLLGLLSLVPSIYKQMKVRRGMR